MSWKKAKKGVYSYSLGEEAVECTLRQREAMTHAEVPNKLILLSSSFYRTGTIPGCSEVWSTMRGVMRTEYLVRRSVKLEVAQNRCHAFLTAHKLVVSHSITPVLRLYFPADPFIYLSMNTAVSSGHSDQPMHGLTNQNWRLPSPPA